MTFNKLIVGQRALERTVKMALHEDVLRCGGVSGAVSLPRVLARCFWKLRSNHITMLLSLGPSHVYGGRKPRNTDLRTANRTANAILTRALNCDSLFTKDDPGRWVPYRFRSHCLLKRAMIDGRCLIRAPNMVCSANRKYLKSVENKEDLILPCIAAAATQYAG